MSQCGSGATGWLAWIAVAVLLGGIYVLYSTNRDLQKDLARVKTESQARQLAQEEAAVESSLAQADELSLLRKDKEELVRLRSEVANLRSLKSQITQLQEENQHLKSTIQQFQAASVELNALKSQNQQLQGALSQQQQQAHRNVCTANRRSIYDIKIRWAADFGKEATDVPEPGELFGPDKYVLQAPFCPSGGTYTLGTVEDPVVCSLPEHGDQ